MRIKLDNDYYIEVEESTYDLMFDTGKVTKETAKTKGGVPITRNHGYHSTLENAVKKYIRLKNVDQDKEVTLMQYVKDFKNNLDRITKIVGGI